MSKNGRVYQLMVPGAKSNAPNREVFAPFDNSYMASVAGSDLQTVEKA